MSKDGLKKKRAYKPKPKINLIVRELAPDHIQVLLPIVTVSEANSSEHWTKKAKRHKAQKELVKMAMKPFKGKITLPCSILIHRLAPRSLDKADNLPTSQKYIIDAVCESITGITQAGRADDHPDIKIEVCQLKSKAYGVSIQIAWGSAGPLAPLGDSCVAPDIQSKAIK